MEGIFVWGGEVPSVVGRETGSGSGAGWGSRINATGC